MSLKKIIQKLTPVFKTLFPAVLVLGAFKAFTFFYAPAPVDQSALNNALSGANPILLEYHASWCSTCLIQRNTLDRVLKGEPYSKIVRFTLNYDTEIALKEKFHVTSQSTLILVKNNREIDRAVGIVSSNDLERFLSKGL